MSHVIPGDRPSPSSSSIILPPGRLVRRDSKSSLSTQLDREALNGVLDTIHTTESQSTGLTVFDDFADPPPSSSSSEPKNLTEELQGSLSGFYNKLKATIGVGKDEEVAISSHSTKQDVRDAREGSKTKSLETQLVKGDESTKTSGTRSPIGPPMEASFHSKESSRPSRLSSKAGSVVSRSSHPTSPAIKSPSNGGLYHSTLVADPLVSESSFNANYSSTTHPRNPSNIDDQTDITTKSPDSQISADGVQLYRVLSQNTVGDQESSHIRDVSVPVSSRALPPTHPARQELKKPHERGISESSVSNKPRPSQPTYVSKDNRDEQNSAASTTGSRDSPMESVTHSLSSKSKTNHDPLQLLESQGRTLPKITTQVDTIPSKQSNATTMLLEDPSKTRTNVRRLPGFQPSRPSSPESSTTGSKSGQVPPSVSDKPRSSQTDRKIQPKRSSFNKVRSKLISKDYWMRDENARDCFHCGESFSTFRRKHHCRVCGQIFDGKCMSQVPGALLGTTGSVRVCKPCEATITNRDDDSSDSEYSIEEAALPSSSRPHTPLAQQLHKRSVNHDDDSASVFSQSLEEMAKTPTMNFPVRRALDSGNRGSAVLEFDVPHPLPRPSSSRSLKATHSLGHNHRRHHSRHQHVRYFKSYHEDRAPFQKRRLEEDDGKDASHSAFHRDSIIDPDLAQYLSDEVSSDDGQSVNIDYVTEKYSKNVHDGDKASLSSLLTAVRKGRSRLGEKNIRDFDDSSAFSARITNAARISRKRNLSVASTVHQRPTPRSTREAIQMSLSGVQDQFVPPSPSLLLPASGSRMIRSASMQGPVAPAMELNKASLTHVQKLLQQLLRDADVPRPVTWETALVPVLLKATEDVNPDVQNGDDLDIRHYVKLKRIPGGKPGDTAYVSGLVFTKNLALKSMPRYLSDPKILIITFSLEYVRREQHFMSLDPVIRQEREYLENLVGRIVALKPDLLLAQRNVSGLALNLLERAKIAVAYNVKPSVLEAVSRCTQSRIVYSIDQLSVHPGQLGTCDSFEVKTFFADGRKKTYIYLSGCIPELGCTIVLRGTDRGTLAKVKRITEFMIYVVYNLKLETCLMRDEWALIPTKQEEESTTKPGLASDRPAGPQPDVLSGSAEARDDAGTENLSKVTTTDTAQVQVNTDFVFVTKLESVEAGEIPDDIPVPTFYEDMVQKHQTKILSASPFVKFKPPYLLMRARELERRVAYLKRLRDQDATKSESMEEKAKAQRFILIQPDMIHASLSGASKKVKEVIHAVHDSEYDKALYNYETQKKQWEAYLSGNRNLFDPYAHQNIAVLFSQVSTATSVPCLGPEVLAFSYYNEHETSQEFEADCTLGQYVEDLCYRANDGCPSNACEKRMDEHHRQYVHGEGQISVFLQPYPAKMRGMHNTILMWSQCKICGTETPMIPMSNLTWKYSFGKYLELSFWSSDLHARASMCAHDLHRDHLRYFGYKDYALRFHYDAIDLLEIAVPRLRITWKVDNDLRFKNEVYTRTEHRITKFMSSVKFRLKSIKADALLPDNAEACRLEIERLNQKANEEHSSLVRQLQDRYTTSRYWETIPLNRAVHLTQEKVIEWDNAFAEFEQNFFPSEKDIRRLATLQLKKIFLDSDVSITTFGSTDGGSVTPPTGEVVDEKDTESTSARETATPENTAHLSTQKTQNVLQSVVKEQSTNASHNDPTLLAKPSNRLISQEGGIPALPEVDRSMDDMRHLDLAVPGSTTDMELKDEQSTSLTVERLSPATISTIQNMSQEASNENPHETETLETTSSVTGNDQARRKPISVPNPKTTQNNSTQAVTQNGESKPSSPPSLSRAHSQPAGYLPLHRDKKNGTSSTLAAVNATDGFGSQTGRPGEITSIPLGHGSEKKLSDRFGLNHLKNAKPSKGHSFIPRSISGMKTSRVSNLAKHFEQLSREFEKERIRERRQRAARNRQSRVLPLAAPKPTVEVYEDVDEAVDEATEDSDPTTEQEVMNEYKATPDTTAVVPNKSPEGSVESHTFVTAEQDGPAPETNMESSETDIEATETSRVVSEAEGDEDESDSDELLNEIHLPESPEDLLRLSHEDLELKELPKHEQTSLLKILRNFWAERSSSGWTPLEYPLNASDHVFADCDIIVREDEPSSIVAFALDSRDYKSMLKDLQEQNVTETDIDLQAGLAPHSHGISHKVINSLLRKTGTHLKYEFQEGPAKMTCKIFYAEQFEAVRKTCGVADRIIESLSRCAKWDSKGGKTRSLFLKTLDDRFVLKSLSPIETQSFLKFAPNYFQIMSEAFFHELPSVIAKMLGFYQVVMKNPATGIEYNWYLILMENLFYDRSPARTFDLKGSMRNRKIESTGERNEVLLDENMVEFIYESPLFTREHSKKLLRSSVHNDTLFLARQNVMDYSLMVAIDESRKELVVGIIDCIRTYTWDKKLESWIKDRGFAGGNRNKPTVTSPKEYKKRFREAMGRYILEAPSCWHQFKPPAPARRVLQIDPSLEPKDGDKGENKVETVG